MTKWKYQTRIFSEEEPVEVTRRLGGKNSGLGTPKEQKENDTYFVGNSDIAARVRGKEIKIKGPGKNVDPLVYEVRDERYDFPLAAAILEEALGVSAKAPEEENEESWLQRGISYMFSGPRQSTATLVAPATTKLRTLDEMVAWAQKMENVIAADVEKESRKYEQPKLEVEVTRATFSGVTLWTVNVAANEPKLIHDAVGRHRMLYIPGGKLMEYAQAIREYSPK